MEDLIRSLPPAEVRATLRLLQRFGVGRKHLALLRTDHALTSIVARIIRRGTTAQYENFARETLGRYRFFGIDDWYTTFGHRFSKYQMDCIPEFPWEPELLKGPCPFEPGKTIAETHFAFLSLARSSSGHPLSLEVLARQDRECLTLRDAAEIQKTACSLRWYLMPLRPVLGTQGMSYEAQAALLPDGYEVASVVEEVQKLLLFRHVGDAFDLWEESAWTVRCRDSNELGSRFCIQAQWNRQKQLVVDTCQDDQMELRIAIAASRRLPK